MLSKFQSRKAGFEGGTGFRNVVFMIAFFLISYTSNAQCAMCRAALQSSGDSAQAEAVNDGIVYLMIIPYILVGVVCIAVYQIRKKKKATA